MTQIRYQITKVHLNEDAINAAYCRMGWRLYATNQQAETLPLGDAVRLYRQAPRIERHFHLFQDAPIGIEPLYVRRDDQIAEGFVSTITPRRVSPASLTMCATANAD